MKHKIIAFTARLHLNGATFYVNIPKYMLKKHKACEENREVHVIIRL